MNQAQIVASVMLEVSEARVWLASQDLSRILASINFWRVSCRDSHQAEPEVYGDYLFDSSTFAEISAIYSIVSKITRFSSIGDFFNFKYTNIVF